MAGASASPSGASSYRPTALRGRGSGDLPIQCRSRTEKGEGHLTGCPPKVADLRLIASLRPSDLTFSSSLLPHPSSPFVVSTLTFVVQHSLSLHHQECFCILLVSILAFGNLPVHLPVHIAAAMATSGKVELLSSMFNPSGRSSPVSGCILNGSDNVVSCDATVNVADGEYPTLD